MDQIAAFLQAYGGWGVAVILGMALFRFYGDFKIIVAEKDTLIQRMGETHAKEMVSVVRECTGVLTAVQICLERCEQRQRCREEKT